MHVDNYHYYQLVYWLYGYLGHHKSLNKEAKMRIKNHLFEQTLPNDVSQSYTFPSPSSDQLPNENHQIRSKSPQC